MSSVGFTVVHSTRAPLSIENKVTLFFLFGYYVLGARFRNGGKMCYSVVAVLQLSCCTARYNPF